jgi:hypothetical protein
MFYGQSRGYSFGIASSRSGGDATAPTLVSATIAADGLTWALVFSEAVTGLAGYVAEFTLDGSVLGADFLNYQSGNGTATLAFTGNSPIVTAEVVTLDYTGPLVEDLAGNDLANFAGFSVTNNSVQ